MQVLGVAPLVSGLPMGSEAHVWIALQTGGADVTERLPAVFRWDAAMEVLVTGLDLFFDGSAVYLDEGASTPFRAHTFEPIRMTEGDEIHLSWVFRREPPTPV